MDVSDEDLVLNREDVSKEERDNEQNEHKVEGQGQMPAPRKYRPTVEPIILFMMVAETVSVSVVTDFFEFKSCQTILNESAANCLNMSNETQSKVQVATANLQMWKSLIESLLPAILAFFIGPWSDVNGRKSLLVVSIFGFVCYHASWAVMSVLPNMPLEYYLLASLPKALTGGWVVLCIAIYCYMIDITTIENRAYRFGILEVGLFIGLGLGNFLSPKFYHFGFAAVFSASAVLNSFCLLYTVFYVEETIVPERGVSYNLFNWRYPYDMMATTFYKRPCNRVCILLVLLLTFFVVIVIALGEVTVMYLWLKQQFHWQLGDFATFRLFSTAILGFGSFAFLWVFSSKLRLPDLSLASLIVFLRICSSVMLVFAISTWQIYAASCVAMFTGALGPLLRTSASKIIPKHEIGKVFALIGAIEAIAPLAAAPLYTLVYDKVIYTAASMVFLVSVFLHSLMMVCLIIIMMIQWRYPAVEYLSINDGNVEA